MSQVSNTDMLCVCIFMCVLVYIFWNIICGMFQMIKRVVHVWKIQYVFCPMIIYSFLSEFSEVVHIMTSCSVPAPPLSPELIQSGVTWLCVRWYRPAGSPKEDEISYVLEMEEEGSVSERRTHTAFVRNASNTSNKINDT